MLSIISTLIVFFCFGVVIYCFLSAKKIAEIAEEESKNEAAAHRILMKLAKVYAMSDEFDGLAKAKALRDLRVEVLNYAESSKQSNLTSANDSSEDVISYAIGKIRLLS